MQTRVAVIGGGVTGLCAAFYLSRALGSDQVTLLEGDQELGGQTRTLRTDGFAVNR